MSLTDTLTDTPIDSAGEVFDPEIHAAKPNGEPALKTDGTFRKKRRDAGRGRAAGATTSTRTKSTSTAGGSRALQDQRNRHVKAVRDGAAVPLTLLSFVQPVDAYCLNELVPPFSEAIADYAQDNPQVAAVLDKVAGAGGLTTVLAIVALGVVQVMHNHDRIPAGVARMMGAKPKAEVEQLLKQRARAMQAEAEQAARWEAEDEAAGAARMAEMADAA